MPNARFLNRSWPGALPVRTNEVARSISFIPLSVWPAAGALAHRVDREYSNLLKVRLRLGCQRPSTNTRNSIGGEVNCNTPKIEIVAICGNIAIETSKIPANGHIRRNSPPASVIRLPSHTRGRRQIVPKCRQKARAANSVCGWLEFGRWPQTGAGRLTREIEQLQLEWW